MTTCKSCRKEIVWTPLFDAWIHEPHTMEYTHVAVGPPRAVEPLVIDHISGPRSNFSARMTLAEMITKAGLS